MSRQLSPIRLGSLRFFYLFNAVVIGAGAWPEVVSPRTSRDLIAGVAFSLYAGYSLLMLLGVLLPLRMLPLLLLQLVYKLIWLAAVGRSPTSAPPGTIRFFAAIVALDLAIIPWRCVFRKFRKSGETEL